MLTITPSLPAQTFAELEQLAQILAGHIPMLQVDIVDGVFVPRRSWPFTESGDPKVLLEMLVTLPGSLPIEIDCMVREPEQYLITFEKIKPASVIVHAGSTIEYDRIIAHARIHGYAIGIGIMNDTDLTPLAKLIDQVDFVQVMGIATIGAQGQPFDERTLLTLTQLKKSYPTLSLVVDGAVNAETITKLRDAGATRFAPGSFIAKNSDPLAAYKQLEVLLTS